MLFFFLFWQVGAGAGKAPSLMNIQMELRKCCNHPFMVRGVEDHEVDQIVGTLMEAAQKEVKKHNLLRVGWVIPCGSGGTRVTQPVP